MADRYWVGGTATWDNTAGTKWSATSGGAGWASVPFTGTFAAGQRTIYGSLTLNADWKVLT